MVLIDHGGRGRHGCVIGAPPTRLADLIDHTWIQQGAPCLQWWVVPDCSAHLIASVYDRDSSPNLRVRIVGPRSVACPIDTTGRRWTVGVRLTPGALPALLGMPADVLTDTAVSPTDILAPALLRGLELSADADASTILASLLRLVERSVRRHPIPHPCPPLHQVATVDELTRLTALSTRALQARVWASVGLPPKRALRILRLHHAWRALARDARLSLADVAHHSGFADQAHFTRESTALLSHSPSAWRALGGADLFKTPRLPAV